MADVFDLQGSISLDTSGFEKSVKKSAEEMNTLKIRLQSAAEEYKKTQTQISDLRKKLEESAKSTGVTSEETKALISEIEKAEKSAEKYKKQINDVSKELNSAGDGTKEFDSSVGHLGDTTESTTSKLGGLASALGSGIKAACEVVIASVTAASAAIAGLTKSSLSEYSSYEQLTGGVDTLFKSASPQVQQYAREAYKTAGLSANEYMQTVTSFSASLIQSIGKASKESEGITEETVSAALSAYDEEYKAAKRAYEDTYTALNTSLTKEIDAYKKATDEKISLVNKEYEERIKLIDDEANRQMSAIDEQIAAINKLSEAENEANKKKKQEDKKKELEEKVANARNSSERFKAEKELAEYTKQIEEQNAQDKKNAERKAQIEELKKQKDAIKTDADARKSELKQQQKDELEQLKESETEQINAMKESQKEQLTALKRHNEDRLEELKGYYTEQKKLYQQAVTDIGGSSISNLTAEEYKKAAELSDLAIRDMSDNANKMGTDMQMIQNAYSGFAKQNYTMLDNLKLGYGGTKTEMERLLKDAEAISGVEYDISSYAEIIKAIHVIQDEIGITGTTAKEASSTIEGSTKQMKASWKNLVVELGKSDGDVDTAFNEFITSVEIAGSNILPRIDVILGNIQNLIETSIPYIFKALPQIIEKVPELVIAGFKIVSAIGKGIYDNREEIISAINKLPGKINEGLRTVDFKGVGSKMSDAIKSGLTGIADFITDIDWEQVGIDLAEAFNGIDWHGVLKAACDGMIAAIKAAPELIKGIVTTIDFDDLALVATLAFAPKFLMKLASELGLSEKWSGVKTTLSGKMGEAGENAAGSQSSGLGFAGKFFIALEAALLGWQIGTKIYEHFDDEIDSLLHPIFEKIKLETWGDNLKEAFGPQEIGGGDVLGGASLASGGVDALLYELLYGRYRRYGFGHAKGGIVTSPQVGVIGEDGAEAIIPLERNTEWIDRVAERLNGSGTHVDSVYITFPNLTIGSDYDADRLVERVSEGLESLKFAQNAAVGGVNW